MSARTFARVPVVVSVGFVAVSVLNIVPATNQLPDDVPRYEEPIEFQSEDDLLAMAEDHDDFVRTRHVFYLRLGQVVDGRSVIAPPGTYLDPGRIRGLARSELIVQEYDPEVGDDVGDALLELPAYRGKLAHHRRGRLHYVIVRETSESDAPFRTVRHNGTLIVVDQAILDDLGESQT